MLDKDLQKVVSYEYNSYGEITKIADENGNIITDHNHIGIKNPYRYKGYRYDEESKLYYLNSRYYNPEWSRFINADSIGGAVGEVLSHNMFAYCLNNPVNMSDESGNWPKGLNFVSLHSTVDKVWNIMYNEFNKDVPPPKESGYKAPKTKGPIKTRQAPGSIGNQKGWPDDKGNVWVPDGKMHGGEGWRVHFPNGSHKHVYPEGGERYHKYSSNYVEEIISIGAVTYVGYRIIRLGVSLIPPLWPTLPANLVMP